jgi:predicted nucleic acid-binding protein
MYLLDTNIVSETRKARPHGAVMNWLREAGERNLHLSAVTLGELQAGVEITRQQDHAKAAELENWVERIAATWSILPMDAAIFRLWAQLMHRQAESLSLDAMIAATARVHRLQIATRNVRDFRNFGVAVLNPFVAR